MVKGFDIDKDMIVVKKNHPSDYFSINFSKTLQQFVRVLRGIVFDIRKASF